MILLIIICKGIQKDNHLEKCPFLCDANWGDSILVEHQNYHKSLENEHNLWLGFDIPQSFGTFSGRDGKRN